jgi:hypothetical protein|tara:strand:+ start:244 stop:858 length:615 start_codon:yes stop_codon:yes gene_type:complete
MSEGIIYILINEGMPGYTKVGRTTTSVEQRMRDLDSTGVPLPFECYFAGRVADMDTAEKHIHDAFDDRRVRQRREFFQVDPERIRSALMLANPEDVTPREDVVDDADDQAALNKARTIRSAFNFKMVDIPHGTELNFTKDHSITCVVVGNRKVEFEGEVTSLSAAALTVVRRMGYNWNQIAGPQYWEYDSETLSERRMRIEAAD